MSTVNFKEAGNPAKTNYFFWSTSNIKIKRYAWRDKYQKLSSFVLLSIEHGSEGN